MSQDLLKIQHALSRLELAKAIKTPEPGAIDAEPWSKSIIFNQPFIKQMLQQREQLSRRDMHTKPKLQNRRKSHSSLNLGTVESKMSKLSMKRSMTETMIARPACLPSDSEEEEDEDDDDDSDSDEKDDSEPFQDASQQKPVSYTQKNHSIESIQDDTSSPSRSSSIICPLTDEEEPISPTHRRMMEQSTHEYRLPHPNEQYTNNNKPIEMIDPMYYQRMQQYQLQLQYQTQLQYQQAMIQQQQLYLRAQTPMAYLPTPTISPPRDQKQAKKRHIRVSSTDLRRRAEMMKNAAEFSTKKPSSYHTFPLQAPTMRMNTRPNYHPI